MLDKEKLWLAVYANINGISGMDMSDYLCEISKSIPHDESVQVLLIPTESGDTRIECIYDPTGNCKEQYEKFFAVANEYINNLVKDKK